MIWKSLPFDGYEVSETGDVRRTVLRMGSKGPVGSLVKQHSNGRRYQFVVLAYERGKKRNFYVHRLVCRAFHGPPPTPAHEVAHWDRDPTNNHYTNVRWATKSENQRDRRRHETLPGQRFYGLALWREVA